MRARLEGDIDGGVFKEMSVFLPDGGNGVDFGVRATVSAMESLADDTSVGDDNSPHHRVGGCA